jgi:hypothetical protein
MNAKRPGPLFAAPSRPVCPVCGAPSYSRAGIHPQCAQDRADEKRMQEVKAKQKSKKPQQKIVSPEAVTSWHKRCPKCRMEVHIRRSACDCGHRFVKSKSG